MLRSFSKIKALALGATFLLAVAAEALQARDGVTGAFLRLGVGARARAMGGAYTAVAAGIEASYYNPAGLPFLEGREILASYRALSLDRQYTFVGFGVPIRPKVAGDKKALPGGFALSWIHAGVSDIDGRNTDGQQTGMLSNSENAFVFSFALNPHKFLSLGLSIKVLWNRFPGIGTNGETISANGVGFDFGALISPREWFTLGISVREINAKYTWNTQDLYGDDGSEVPNRFPKTVRTGIAVRPPQIEDLLFAVEYEDSRELDGRFHLGAEKGYREDIRLRAGFDDGSFTVGGGYDFDFFGKRSQLNYAFLTPGNRAEEEHIFTWVFRF